MGSRFPYFYYDTLARVVPGAATIVVLIFVLTNSAVQDWLIPDENEAPEIKEFLGTLVKDPSTLVSVLVPVVALGLAYAIGVLYEVLFAWAFTRRWRHRLRVFRSQARNYVWRVNVKDPDFLKDRRLPRWQPCLEEHNDVLSHQAWNWLTLCDKDDKGRAFTYAHRFQAEAKMCLHCIFPVLLYVPAMAVICILDKGRDWPSHHLPICIGLAYLLWLGFLNRERRRWIQVLISIDELKDHTDRGLVILQARCQDLSKYGGFLVWQSRADADGRLRRLIRLLLVGSRD